MMNMDNNFFLKRISETTSEIYPLDRLLPIESVYMISLQEYEKSSDKNLFFRDRKYQRLREGYFAMFVAVALQDYFNYPHYLVFPTNPDNDVYIAYRLPGETNEKMGAYPFDIKEYTNWSSTFDKFLQKNVLPKLEAYSIAVSTYRKIDGNDIKSLIDYLQSKNLSTGVWFLGSPTEEDQGYDISSVTIVNKDGILYEKVIDLNDWIDKTRPIVVFQDIIRFK